MVQLRTARPRTLDRACFPARPIVRPAFKNFPAAFATSGTRQCLLKMNSRSSTLHGKDQRASHICHPKDRRNVTNPGFKTGALRLYFTANFREGARPACMCLFFYRLRFLYIILYQRIDKPSMYKKRNTGRTPARIFLDNQHPHDHFTVFLLPWHSITAYNKKGRLLPAPNFTKPRMHQ